MLKILFISMLLLGSPLSHGDDVKAIEAEEFQVRALKSSRSGNVVLFEDLDKNRPATGKVLLIKLEKTDILAVRVLKNYKGKFAAKIIHKFADLQSGTGYRALKKIGDKVSDLVASRENRANSPKDAALDANLANDILPDDTELDKGIPAPANDAASDAIKPLFTKGGDELSGQDSMEIPDDDDSYYDPYSYEIQPIETMKSAVSVEFSTMNSVDKDAGKTQYNALGLRYAYVLGRFLIFNKRNIQDSLSAEISAFYYSISNFRKATDSVSILPLGGTFRYNLHLGDYLTLFPYVGGIMNLITSSVDVTDTGALGASQLMLGAGMQLKVGPSWSLRVDYGLEMTAFGVTLKF